MLVNWVRVKSQCTLGCRSIKNFLLNLIKIGDIVGFKQGIRFLDMILFHPLKGISVVIAENGFEEAAAVISSWIVRGQRTRWTLSGRREGKIRKDQNVTCLGNSRNKTVCNT